MMDCKHTYVCVHASGASMYDTCAFCVLFTSFPIVVHQFARTKGHGYGRGSGPPRPRFSGRGLVTRLQHTPPATTWPLPPVYTIPVLTPILWLSVNVWSLSCATASPAALTPLLDKLPPLVYPYSLLPHRLRVRFKSCVSHVRKKRSSPY